MDREEYEKIADTVIDRVRERTNAIIHREFLDDCGFERIVEDVMNMAKSLGLEGYRLYTFVDDVLMNIALKMHIKKAIADIEEHYTQAHQDDDEEDEEHDEDGED